MKNYYDILEIPYTASQKEIQQAHKELSENYHPDRNDGVSFFNTVYNEIQDAYNVLSDESLKAEYDSKNSISNAAASSGNDPVQPLYKSRKIKREELNSKKPKTKSFSILKFALPALFILAIGFLFFLSLPSEANGIPGEENEMGFDFRNSNEENLRSLLDLESSRDIDIVSTFYSKKVERYWDLSNIDEERLKEQYKNNWSKTLNSQKKILNIKVVGNNTLDVETEVSYVDFNSNNPVSQIYFSRYVFNNNGLITQVYNIDQEKKEEEIKKIIPVKNPDIPEKKQIPQRSDMVSDVPNIQNIDDENIADVAFAMIDEVPIFPGCEEMMNNESRKKCMSEKVQEFVTQRFNTDLGSQLGLSGINRVIVVFKIDKTGAIADVRARAPHPRLEQEAAGVINLLPGMVPGRQRGKAVGVSYSLPIVFQVQD